MIPTTLPNPTGLGEGVQEQGPTKVWWDLSENGRSESQDILLPGDGEKPTQGKNEAVLLPHFPGGAKGKVKRKGMDRSRVYGFHDPVDGSG